MDAQDVGLCEPGVRLFLHEVSDVAHRRGDVVGFPFLLFTS